MSARALALAAALALAPAPALADATPAPRATLESARALVRALAAHGRAEATIERVATPFGAREPRRVRGRLVLEVPDRARLEFPDTGERITLRADGGEWLQPQLDQLLTLEASHARTARRWWSLLTEGSAERFGERRLGPSRWLVWTTDGDGDSARVRLDAAALPATLVVREGGGLEAEYRFRDWRFAAPRGEADFRIAPPPGVRVVPLP